MPLRGLFWAPIGGPFECRLTDNALAETINGLYKTELIHRSSWKSFKAVELATLTWVDWFNNRRILEPIGNIPPAEAEKQFYVALEAMPVAA